MKKVALVPITHFIERPITLSIFLANQNIGLAGSASHKGQLHPIHAIEGVPLCNHHQIGAKPTNPKR
jgi:hypothetical protein